MLIVHSAKTVRNRPVYNVLFLTYSGITKYIRVVFVILKVKFVNMLMVHEKTLQQKISVWLE